MIAYRYSSGPAAIPPAQEPRNDHLRALSPYRCPNVRSDIFSECDLRCTNRLRGSWRRVRDVRKAKQTELVKAGWRLGSAADFLQLTPEERAFVELKLALADYLRELRTQLRLTQADVAARLGSSQSRVAKMEAGDGTVSLDLLVKALLLLGASREQLGKVIG